MESAFPSDTMILFKFGVNDVAAKEALQKLVTFLPGDLNKGLLSVVAQWFIESFPGADGPEEDFIGAIGEDSGFMFGISGNIGAPSDPDMALAMVVSDAGFIESFMKKSVLLGSGFAERYGIFKIYDGIDGNSFVAVYKDIVILTNGIESMHEVLDRLALGGKSLLSNAAYEKGLGLTVNSFAYVFVDPKISKLSFDAAANLSGLKDSNIGKLLDMLDGEFIAFSAEPTGIRLVGSVYGDPQKWEEVQKLFDLGKPSSYMFNTVPGDDVIFYLEGFNLKEAAKIVESVYSKTPEFSQMFPLLRIVLAANGLDLEKDVLSFMDKGFAIALYGGNSVIPGFGVFVDSSSNNPAAEKFMSIIFSRLGDVISNLQSNADYAIFGIDKFLTHAAKSSKTGIDYGLILDLEKMSALLGFDVYPAGMDLTRAELHYGVRSDNLAYFALFNDFEKQAYTPLGQNETFLDARKNIDGLDYHVGYFNIVSALDYVDKVAGFDLQTSDPDLAEYALVRSYFAPFKSFIFGSMQNNSGEVEFQGFLKIGPAGN